MRRYSKLIGALLGGGVPAAVLAVVDAAGVHLATGLSAAIVTLCATLATYAAPANAPSTER